MNIKLVVLLLCFLVFIRADDTEQIEWELPKMLDAFKEVMRAYEVGDCDQLAPHFALGTSKKIHTAIVSDPWEDNKYVKGRAMVVKKCKREREQMNVDSQRYSQELLYMNGDTVAASINVIQFLKNGTRIEYPKILTVQFEKNYKIKEIRGFWNASGNL